VFDAIKKLFSRKRRAAHLELGELGERAALAYLKREGYNIVATNFRVPMGRGLRGHKITAEIDIIAYEGDVLAFIEVKARSSDEVAAPERAITLRKQRQIARAAHRYRSMMNVTGEPYRYDVVSIVAEGERLKIELLRGYFDDGVFRRGRYFSYWRSDL
jgi:putative endonuclease